MALAILHLPEMMFVWCSSHSLQLLLGSSARWGFCVVPRGCVCWQKAQATCFLSLLM